MPTWFLAQTCRLRDKSVRFFAEQLGIETGMVSHEQYNGPFQPQNVKENGVHTVMKLSDAKFLIRTKFGERRVKWLQAGIDRVCGRKARGDSEAITLSNDDVLSIACAMDRLELGVNSYSEVVKELKSIMWHAGHPWSKVPVDFKKKLRMIAST